MPSFKPCQEESGDWGGRCVACLHLLTETVFSVSYRNVPWQGPKYTEPSKSETRYSLSPIVKMHAFKLFYSHYRNGTDSFRYYCRYYYYYYHYRFRSRYHCHCHYYYYYHYYFELFLDSFIFLLTF